jgi:flagellar assembly protein FliH
MALTLLELLQPLPDRPNPNEPPPPVEIPEEILEEARAEAARIVADAQSTASTIIDEAHVQSETIRQKAWQEGHQQGQQSARQEVEEQLRREVEAYLDGIRQDMQEIVNAIAEGRQRLWEQQEAEMLQFVLDISRQVIKTEVQQNEDVLMQILRNAMRRVTDKENMRIRVCTSDAPRIKAAREEVMQIVDGIRTLEIVDDRRIGPGGCVIETNAGTIDAKIETQLGEIEKTILECE